MNRIEIQHGDGKVEVIDVDAIDRVEYEKKDDPLRNRIEFRLDEFRHTHYGAAADAIYEAYRPKAAVASPKRDEKTPDLRIDINGQHAEEVLDVFADYNAKAALNGHILTLGETLVHIVRLYSMAAKGIYGASSVDDANTILKFVTDAKANDAKSNRPAKDANEYIADLIREHNRRKATGLAFQTMAKATFNVLDAIVRERAYQDKKWGPPSEHGHEVGGWLTIMDKELREAKDAWASKNGDRPALAEVIQVVAVGVACLEQHGVVDRSDAKDGGRSGVNLPRWWGELRADETYPV